MKLVILIGPLNQKKCTYDVKDFCIFLKDGCLVNGKDESQKLDFSVPQRWKVYKRNKLKTSKRTIWQAICLNRYNQYEISELYLFDSIEEARNMCTPFYGAIPVEVHFEE